MSIGRSVTLICTLSISATAFSAAALAEQDPKPNGRIRMDETVISGNQELPKVLYIVPWQDPSGIPKIELDPNFTEHEVFRHLYPPAYKRELQYYDALKSLEAKP